MRIKVEVDGRPPRKSVAKSLWNSKESEYVIKLRKAIRKRQRDTGSADLFKDKVKITLAVRARHISDEKVHGYVGDIDSFVAGVCDAIQPAHYNVKKWDDGFTKDILPKSPFLIQNDSRVVEVHTKKIECDDEGYTLIVEDA